MKTVVLFRHGKSDWNAGYGADHERPLNRRGRKAAALMGRYLADLGEAPDIVICSSAVRARETAELAREAGEWSSSFEVAADLYESSPEQVLTCLRSADDGADSVLLVGHEPTGSQLASLLLGGASLRFPTASMARIDVDATRWREVEAGAGVLAWLATPKQVAKIE